MDNTTTVILLAVGGAVLLVCGGVAAVFVAGVVSGFNEVKHQQAAADAKAAEATRAEAAPELDLNNPRSVLAYWVSYQPKSGIPGNALTVDPNEADKYYARVKGQRVRWLAVVRQVDKDGSVVPESSHFWPFAGKDEWLRQQDDPPRNLYYLAIRPETKPVLNDQPVFGFPASDFEWAKTLHKGDRFAIVGTLTKLVVSDDGMSARFGPERRIAWLVGCYAVIADCRAEPP
jgi:hypothetical protein